MLALESRQAVRVLDQDALHFLNRFRIALHGMRRMDDLLRCDAVDMRARIFYHSVSSICRRATAFHADDGMGDHSIGDGGWPINRG